MTSEEIIAEGGRVLGQAPRSAGRLPHVAGGKTDINQRARAACRELIEGAGSGDVDEADDWGRVDVVVLTVPTRAASRTTVREGLVWMRRSSAPLRLE